MKAAETSGWTNNNNDDDRITAIRYTCEYTAAAPFAIAAWENRRNTIGGSNRSYTARQTIDGWRISPGIRSDHDYGNAVAEFF